MGRELPTPPLGAPGPFGLADPDNNIRILSAAGFENVANEAVSEPLWFGADADDAFGWSPSRARAASGDNTGGDLRLLP